jgi:vacuolar-type H+-ATPase subunit H
MISLGVYSDADAAGRVVLLAQQIVSRVVEYRRSEAENIIADAQAWAKYLEHDAQDRQREVKVLAGDDNEQRVFWLACATADRAIADARDEAIKTVADAQARAESLDRDVLERHLHAMSFVRTSGREINVAGQVLSLGQAAADQVIVDARHEAARIVADAKARVLALAARQP